MAKSVGFGVKTEQRIIGSDSKQKPADIHIDGMIKSKATSIDITVVNPTAKSNIPIAKSKVGNLLEKAEQNKAKKYAELINKGTVKDREEFLTFAIDTYGGFGKEAVVICKRLAFESARQNNEEVRLSVAQIRQTITACLFRSVANQIMIQKR